MNYGKVLKELYSIDSPKFKLGLGRVEKLLAKLGNPQDTLKCIHVVGTSGKGSVCAMIFYILKEAGYGVGLYTSPHLKRFNERIRINEKLITDREIVDYYLKVKSNVTDQSFFEITTSMAFLYFMEKNVDFVVLETGLGGRLDATNVITPRVSVITKIGIDHTKHLGNSIEKIAYEKAGIIKKNVPVVAGAGGKAFNTIGKVAKKRKSQLVLPKKHPKVNFNSLLGDFQQENAGIALAAIDILRKNNQISISQKQINEGLRKTAWPGRLQFISRNALVDCAHNPLEMENLVREIWKLKYENIIFVLGFSGDKDIKSMMELIKPIAHEVIFTKSDSERAAEPEKLVKYCKTAKIVENPKKALRYAKKVAKKNDLVVVAGSVFLVGEII